MEDIQEPQLFYLPVVTERNVPPVDFQSAVETIKQYLPDYAGAHLKRSKEKNKFVCVFCGSGNGANSTGAFTVYRTNYYCFSCHQHGDIFDLAEKVENISKHSVVQYLADKYHVRIDFLTERRKNLLSDQSFSSLSVIRNGGTATKECSVVSDVENCGEENFDSFFSETNKYLCETSYHRGISIETLNHFNIGFVAEWKHPKNPHSPASPRLIIPTSSGSYLARDTRNEDEIPESQKSYVKSKVGRVHIFNEKTLETGDIVYVVEGELDALSIIDAAGYDSAVGLGSVSNVDFFLSVLDKTEHRPKLIIALDNDSAGEKARNELTAGFDERGIEYCVYDPCCGFKDPNEALINSSEAFRMAVIYGIEHVDDFIAKRINDDETVRKTEYDDKFSAKVFLRDFVDGISESVNTEVIPTGFEALDSMLDGGLYEGLYCIGAISSLGKTTFALQMADQIAAQGHEVLVFSLEMSRNELIAKSISRNTFRRVKQSGGIMQHAKTTRGIISCKKYNSYCQAEKELIRASINDYEKIAGNIFIREGIGDVTAETFTKQVSEHIESGHKPPVVIVDYLQILSPKNEKWTDKQNTDSAILTFKRLSRDYKIPVIVISSFNRENYSVKVSMQAFKESGAIEYSTDVLIGLQLKGVGNKNFDIDQAKSKNPREVEAVILKNRNGRTGGKIGFDFYAMFNCFVESDAAPEPSDDVALTGKKSRRL